MDKFTKIRNIGKGNMGACALARNNEDGRYYVIKQVDLSRMNKKERQQSLNEARVLSSLRHPNVINYVDSFLAKKSDHLCIVMEYADGGDLSSRIKKNGTVNFRETQVLDWFIQLVLSLHYIHKRKILHRDVKTQNVFLTSDNIVKLGDFGIARTLNGTYDQAKTFVGTPYYLSPELILERPYDARSDVWALGVVLYELLTLKHPFNATDMKGLMQRILKVQYDPVPMLYSVDVRNLVARLLVREPSQRIHLSELLELPVIARRIAEWIGGNAVPRPYVDTLLKQSLLPESVLQGTGSSAGSSKPPTGAPSPVRNTTTTAAAAYASLPEGHPAFPVAIPAGVGTTSSTATADAARGLSQEVASQSTGTIATTGVTDTTPRVPPLSPRESDTNTAARLLVPTLATPPVAVLPTSPQEACEVGAMRPPHELARAQRPNVVVNARTTGLSPFTSDAVPYRERASYPKTSAEGLARLSRPLMRVRPSPYYQGLAPSPAAGGNVAGGLGEYKLPTAARQVGAMPLRPPNLENVYQQLDYYYSPAGGARHGMGGNLCRPSFNFNHNSPSYSRYNPPGVHRPSQQMASRTPSYPAGPIFASGLKQSRMRGRVGNVQAESGNPYPSLPMRVANGAPQANAAGNEKMSDIKYMLQQAAMERAQRRLNGM